MPELRPVTEDDVRTFATWRYPAPYDVYDIDEEPDTAVAYFLDPAVGCHVLLEEGELVGFCTFGHDARVPGGDYSLPALDIGMGIAPERTGQGRGGGYVAAVLEHARATNPNVPFRVTIAANNERALRVWQGAGFEAKEHFDTEKEMMGARRFVVLVSG